MKMQPDSEPLAYEFFAGGGMARLGLAPFWRIGFANDFDGAKCAHYRLAFGGAAIDPRDVAEVAPSDLPGRPALVWASFPCQDLSLAGGRGGLSAPRSGAFWPFWRLMEALIAEQRAPAIIGLENVVGLLSSRSGADFAALIKLFAQAHYVVAPIVLDAALFVPQSRKRLFLLAFRQSPPASAPSPAPFLADAALMRAVAALPPTLRRFCVWPAAPAPRPRRHALADLLLADDEVAWDAPEQSEALLALMAPAQRERVEALMASGARVVGALFRRMRGPKLSRRQRVEARFDGLAGCLRTPAGGSSRQRLILIERGIIRTRLLAPREAARLMGLPEDYPLPGRLNAALHLLGDGVAAPVVRYLSQAVLEPFYRAQIEARAA